MKLAKNSNNWLPTMPSFFDKFFDGGLADWNFKDLMHSQSHVPAANVIEKEKSFEVEVALPGVNKDDIKIDYNQGNLSISSEQKVEIEEKDGNRLTHMEFCYHAFSRVFSVPEDLVDVDKITANHKNGVLRISLPKKHDLKSVSAKQIQIK